MRRLRYRRGFGHAFGVLLLFRHPVVILVIVFVVLASFLYRRRR